MRVWGLLIGIFLIGFILAADIDDVSVNSPIINGTNGTFVNVNSSSDVCVTGGNCLTNALTSDIYIDDSDEATLNVNSSTYWANVSSFNTTQIENSGGVLNILVSWFTTQFNALFGAKTTDDLSQGSNNFYDNQSWNESRANTLYADISVTGDNTTWAEDRANTLYYSINNPLNFLNQTQTDLLYAILGYGDDWNKTYADTLYAPIGSTDSWSKNYTNYYTKSQVDNNFSLYLLLTDQRFNETGWVQSQNYLTSYIDTWSLNYTDYNTSSEVDTALAAQDECSEITNCVVGAITTVNQTDINVTSIEVKNNITNVECIVGKNGGTWCFS